MGSLATSTVKIQFSRRKTKEEKKAGAKAGVKQNRTGKVRGGVWTGPPMALVSATRPCYIMDGMGECECCIRQGGLQGRADTEDTPEASPLMPDMLLRLQGFS